MQPVRTHDDQDRMGDASGVEGEREGCRETAERVEAMTGGAWILLVAVTMSVVGVLLVVWAAWDRMRLDEREMDEQFDRELKAHWASLRKEMGIRED